MKERLIDADAFQRKLLKLEAEPDYRHPDEDWCVGVCMAESILEEMPTVDAEPVIRCKDCACMKVVRIGGATAFRCPYSTVDVEPEGYCHRGVKRTEQTEGGDNS